MGRLDSGLNRRERTGGEIAAMTDMELHRRVADGLLHIPPEVTAAMLQLGADDGGSDEDIERALVSGDRDKVHRLFAAVVKAGHLDAAVILVRDVQSERRRPVPPSRPSRSGVSGGTEPTTHRCCGRRRRTHETRGNHGIPDYYR